MLPRLSLSCSLVRFPCCPFSAWRLPWSAEPRRTPTCQPAGRLLHSGLGCAVYFPWRSRNQQLCLACSQHPASCSPPPAHTHPHSTTHLATLAQQVVARGAKFSLFKPAEEMVYIGLDDESRTKGEWQAGRLAASCPVKQAGD